MPNFEAIEVSKTVSVIKINGDLKQLNNEPVFERVFELINQGTKHVVLDCAELGYISSSGLASLLGARRKIQSEGGKIYLAELNSTITKILELTKLNKFFAIFPSVDELVNRLETDRNFAGTELSDDLQSGEEFSDFGQIIENWRRHN